MIRRPPRPQRTYKLFPYTTLFPSRRSIPARLGTASAATCAARRKRSLRPRIIAARPTSPFRARPAPRPIRRSPTIAARRITRCRVRSEEHTSELQSLMRISYAVFCLIKKTHREATRDECRNGQDSRTLLEGHRDETDGRQTIASHELRTNRTQ